MLSGKRKQLFKLNIFIFVMRTAELYSFIDNSFREFYTIYFLTFFYREQRRKLKYTNHCEDKFNGKQHLSSELSDLHCFIMRCFSNL